MPLKYGKADQSQAELDASTRYSLLEKQRASIKSRASRALS
jgi:hypothetical protein